MPAVSEIDLARELRALAARRQGGGTGTAARLRAEALAMIADEALASPAFSYRISEATAARDDRIAAGGLALHAPALASSGGITALAAAACTLGAAMDARITQLFALRRPSLALALDAVARELLFRLADRAYARIRRDARKQGLDAGIETNPGDDDIALDQQPAVLTLADAEQIGITASTPGMLSPVRSISFVVALGHGLAGRSAAGGRCKRCPSRDRCTSRVN